MAPGLLILIFPGHFPASPLLPALVPLLLVPQVGGVYELGREGDSEGSQRVDKLQEEMCRVVKE